MYKIVLLSYWNFLYRKDWVIHDGIYQDDVIGF